MAVEYKLSLARPHRPNYSAPTTITTATLTMAVITTATTNTPTPPPIPYQPPHHNHHYKPTTTTITNNNLTKNTFKYSNSTSIGIANFTAAVTTTTTPPPPPLDLTAGSNILLHHMADVTFIDVSGSFIDLTSRKQSVPHSSHSIIYSFITGFPPMLYYGTFINNFMDIWGDPDKDFCYGSKIWLHPLCHQTSKKTIFFLHEQDSNKNKFTQKKVYTLMYPKS